MAIEPDRFERDLLVTTAQLIEVGIKTSDLDLVRKASEGLITFLRPIKEE